MRGVSLSGHLWTLGPFVRHALRAPSPPPSIPFEVDVPDERHGAVPVRGWLSRKGRRACVVAVHGLGGDANSAYLVEFAREAWERGHDVLRLGMRGSDGRGDDVYHAGLAVDVAAAIGSPALAAYEEIRLVGFSLGGHLALRYATGSHDARLRAVAAIGSPLDLERGAVAIDAPARWPYRQHVLRALQVTTDALHRRGRLDADPAALRRLRTLRGWDGAVVAPRFGFTSAEAYYASESVAPRLSKLAVPGLYVGATHDPMVLAETVRPALTRASPKLDERWIERAGHIGFPSALDLGEPGARGFAPQLLSWLERQR